MSFHIKLPSWTGLALGLMMAVQACTFSAKATRRLLNKASEQGPFDIIIVPGVPFEGDTWSRAMKGRVLWSKYLYDRGIAKNVLYSGAAVYTPYGEAEIMALYGRALGIPQGHIFTEKKAEHSTENIYYGYKLAKRLGFRKIALASDPFQVKMLRKFTRKRVGPDVRFIPMVFDSVQAMALRLIDPAIKYQDAFQPVFVPLPERESFWQRFRGTRGLNLDKQAYDE